jgi:hypothetical protein
MRSTSLPLADDFSTSLTTARLSVPLTGHVRLNSFKLPGTEHRADRSRRPALAMLNAAQVDATARSCGK